MLLPGRWPTKMSFSESFECVEAMGRDISRVARETGGGVQALRDALTIENQRLAWFELHGKSSMALATEILIAILEDAIASECLSP